MRPGQALCTLGPLVLRSPGRSTRAGRQRSFLTATGGVASGGQTEQAMFNRGRWRREQSAKFPGHMPEPRRTAGAIESGMTGRTDRATSARGNNMPGTPGEHELQQRHGTTRRAEVFYANQMLDHINERMQAFIARMDMMFVATASASGEADCTFRAGAPGFVRILDERTVAYPEYRGNGVMASLGNISENGHIGLLFIDFVRDTIGLHVNGTARIVENLEMLARPDATNSIILDIGREGGRTPERWVVVDVEEAYIHCSKHIPLFSRRDKTIEWGTDDTARKGGDYFGVSSSLAGVPRDCG